MDKKNYGLTSAQAEESLKKHGNNKLSVKESQSLFSMFVESFKDKWIIILLLALFIKVAFIFIGIIFPQLGEQEWYDAASILAAILLSTGFSTVSSYRNEQKFNALQAEASKTKAKVFRDGKLLEIMVDDIVKGDAIMLQAGDKIPVDGYLLSGEMKVNQAALNGESEEAKKKASMNPEKDFTSEDTFNAFSLFRGSVVTSGEGILHASVIGDSTMLGGIAQDIQEDSKESPSKEKLGKLADQIGILGYAGGAISAVINVILGIAAMNTAGTLSGMAIGMLIMESIMLGVSIVIMAVPEGLPMMLALVSAMNSGKLLSKHILVRHSDTIETAGFMNILFSDKTGTITEGTLSVVELMDGIGDVLPAVENLRNSLKDDIVNGMGLNNDSFVSDGKAIGSNSTDRALLEYLMNHNCTSYNKDEIAEKKAFSSATKFASVTTKGGITYIKGAPEYLINDKCKYYLDKDGQQQAFTSDVLSKLNTRMFEQAGRAMRLLAVMKYSSKKPDEKTLISVLCIRDNVRKGIDKTVDVMNNAGVQVVMVTGDRKETAVAIAKEANIIRSDEDVALTHDELAAMTDEEVKNILPKLKVVSRALPMDKKRLVQCAQELDLVCGMTGDGVNDAPALKAADVGFSVGDGTEVAKEASDIVILNNSLSSIEQAVLFGRTMSKSVAKFIIFCRVFDGTVKKGTNIRMMATEAEAEVVQVGIFGAGQFIPCDELSAGMVGYITASLKNVKDTTVGDTVTDADNPCAEALPGYKKVNPMVYCGLYPADGAKYPDLRDALEKLQLNDASLSYEPETSIALGFGFRCGFLGLLHLEIIQERLEREYNLDLVTTAPGVIYRVHKTDGEVMELTNPSNLPDPSTIEYMEEPFVSAEIMVTTEYVGAIMQLCQERRGVYKSMEYMETTRALLKYDLPLNEIIYDFFDALKSRSRGYASFDYEMKGYVRSDLVKLDILINKEEVDALSFILHKDTAYERGRKMCEKLKEEIPRQLFEIPIQAAIGSKVIARETVKAMRKDVLAKCYGGDISRKRKLLEKQKEGKKRMRQVGNVEIPQKAFMSVLKLDEE